MDANTLSVLITLPHPWRPVLGEQRLQRLGHAHPRVRVELVADQEELATRLPQADGLLLGPGFCLPPAVVAPDARLRWVHSLTAGVDWLLTPEVAAADHLQFTSSKGPIAPLVAEHAAMLMLALARALPAYLRQQDARHWQEQPMAQVFGKTIAILGVGAAGGHLARLCQVGLRMQVLGLTRTRRDHPHVDRYVDRSQLHAALGEADVVALCLPLTPATERIIDVAALAAMKPSALLINVARGGLVDEPALVAALQAGRLGGAGLDATAVEPLPADNPLWALPNVIITPHVGRGGDQLVEHQVDFWLENIRRFAEGEPLLGTVDQRAGY